MMNFKSLRCALLALILLNTCALQAGAQDRAGVTVAPPAVPAPLLPTVPTTNNNEPPRQPLRAGAEVVVITLNDLRDVGLDLDHLHSAATRLYAESTLQRMTLQTVPNLVGPGTIINLPVGTFPTGEYIPPRPQRVQAAMAEIRSLSSLLKSDVDAFMSGEKQLVLPGQTAAELHEELRQWMVSVTNIYGQMSILERLTAAPPYNQGAMAQATWAIVEDAKQLEQITRVMYKALQREGKREESAQGRKRW